MELNWCRRLHLDAAVAAYAVEEGALSTAILDVEGPGAGTALSMEAGLHRLCRKERRDLRVRIELHEKSAAALPVGVTIHPAGRAAPKGPFGWSRRAGHPS